MCQDSDCPKRETCWRWTAYHSRLYQTFADFEWRGKCDYYMEIDIKTNLPKMR